MLYFSRIQYFKYLQEYTFNNWSSHAIAKLFIGLRFAYWNFETFWKSLNSCAFSWRKSSYFSINEVGSSFSSRSAAICGQSYCVSIDAINPFALSAIIYLTYLNRF